ncbi:hypothetical protein J6590_103101 [Homalodisca vitripennis]|nr:hypothetical protein J6590_103101 [Homalodisca vitripennis]
MIDACHRLKYKTDSTKPAGIVVRFVRRIDKKALMQKKREERDFSTRHLGMAMDMPVFINESLTRTRRIIFAKARELKKNKGFKFLWQRGGNIFLRKCEEDDAIAITYQADFDKLHYGFESVINEPTRTVRSADDLHVVSSTCLDHVYTRILDKSRLCVLGSVVEEGITDHSLCVVQVKGQAGPVEGASTATEAGTSH